MVHLTCNLDRDMIAAGERLGWHAFAAELLGEPAAVRNLLDIALLIHGVDYPPSDQAWTSCEHGEKEAAFFAEALGKSIDLLRETGGLE